MKSPKNFRKSHSAKVCKLKSNLLISEKRSNSRKSCLSASCLTERDARNLKLVNADVDYFDRVNPKSILKASQLLEKLKKIKCKFAEGYDNNQNERNTSDKHDVQLSFRQVTLYYESLKKLLKKRYVLFFKEEVAVYVERCRLILFDLKIMYNDEVIKLTTLPVNSYHRIIDISGLTVTFLEKLFKKLNFLYEINLSLKNTYQSILNFHIDLNLKFHQKLLKIYFTSNEFYLNILFWSYKILDLFILKLCLSDPNSISPEFLHHVLDIFKSLNLLLLNKKQLMLECYFSSECDFLNYFISSDYEKLLLDLVLKYLTYFEAKVASAKLTYFLVSECKKQRDYTMKEKDIKSDLQSSDCKTSDYLSESLSVSENENICVSNTIFSFASIFSVFVQRSQSLVLKYFYSVIHLDAKEHLSQDHYAYSPKVIRRWNLPQWQNNHNYNIFEEQYWKQFWMKVSKFSLKVILETPCHQYGNMNIGTFLFWPQHYQLKFLEFLKLCIDHEEFSTDGLNILRSLQYNLISYNLRNTWDESITSAICSIEHDFLVPVSSVVNGGSTRSTNALSTCIHTLVKFFPHCPNIAYHYIQYLYEILGALNCFLYIVTTKVTASVSSHNYSIFILVTCSDCEHVCRILEEKVISCFLSKCKDVKWFWIDQLKWHLIHQVEIVNGFVFDSPHVLYKITSNRTKEVVFPALQTLPFFFNSFPSDNFLFKSFDEILLPLSGIKNSISNVSALISAVMSAVCNEILFILRKMRSRLSLKRIQTIKKLFIHFLKWLEQLNLDEGKLTEISEMKCLKSVLCDLQNTEFQFRQSKWCLPNRISPMLNSNRATSNM